MEKCTQSSRTDYGINKIIRLDVRFFDVYSGLTINGLYVRGGTCHPVTNGSNRTIDWKSINPVVRVGLKIIYPVITGVIIVFICASISVSTK